jgi:hypothetical protein
MLLGGWFLRSPVPDVADNITPASTSTIPAESTVAPNQADIEETTITPEPTFVVEQSSPLPTPNLALDELTETIPTPTSTIASFESVDLPPGCINGARFYDDLTIPDGTEIVMGQKFEKVWSLQNNGSCPWVAGYTIRFVDGEVMHEIDQIPVPTVQPEMISAITVPMVAPDVVGNYRSQWQMHDQTGKPFGADMYVEIVVVTPEPGAIIENPDEITLYDFVDNATVANWNSDDITYNLEEKRIDSSLVITAPLGIVVSGIAEMRGRRDTPKKVLLTHPHQEIGFIEGVYPVDISLQPTDELVVTLGFPQTALLNKDGATFEVVFTPDDGAIKLLLSEQTNYRDGPVTKRVSLAGISPGQTGSFTLQVLGGKSSAYDWALWLDARLVRSK